MLSARKEHAQAQVGEAVTQHVSCFRTFHRPGQVRGGSVGKQAPAAPSPTSSGSPNYHDLTSSAAGDP